MATVAKERELFEGAGFGKSVYICVRVCWHSTIPNTFTNHCTHSGQKKYVTFIFLSAIEAPDLLEPKKFEAFRYVQFCLLYFHLLIAL